MCSWPGPAARMPTSRSPRRRNRRRNRAAAVAPPDQPHSQAGIEHIMQSFWAMTIANLKMTVRNRQAIFWNLAFPAIFILIFGAVFGNDSLSTIDIGVAGPASPTRDQVIQGLRSSDAF